MLLRFLLAPEHSRDLTEMIEKSGFYPTEYERKYPRIPQMPHIQTYPMRVVSTPTETKGANERLPIIFDVRNLSLGGILLSTENRNSDLMDVGDFINIFVEPRGDFSIPIAVQGKICWIMDEKNIPNENLVRYMGVKFTYLDEENRAGFLDLIKDILKRLREIAKP